MRRRAKIDVNQPEIVEALRGIGASVRSTAMLGEGFPDLVVGLRGETFLLEVKTPKGKLTKDEMCFMTEWRGHYMIVRNVEQAIDAVTNIAARRIEMKW